MVVAYILCLKSNSVVSENEKPFEVIAVNPAIIEDDTMLDEDNNVIKSETVNKYLRIKVEINNITDQEYDDVWFKLELNKEVEPYLAAGICEYISDEKMHVIPQASNNENNTTAGSITGFLHEWEMQLTAEEDLKEYYDMTQDGIKKALKEICVTVYWNGGEQSVQVPIQL